jgi:hypothetical protein
MARFDSLYLMILETWTDEILGSRLPETRDKEAVLRNQETREKSHRIKGINKPKFDDWNYHF